MILVGKDSEGNIIDSETLEKLFRFSSNIDPTDVKKEERSLLDPEIAKCCDEITATIQTKNQENF